ncbi:N-acetylmuramoyl-L-alanine amidase [Pseudobutyrivibrio sp.]|uniref:N-acetylmuramoyl-L-alanine amidase n=1 Tax=Pseudobutyrivibrio sp. TaxID=2014367 RepID=UPI001E1743E7|nr:N-acetylmuramoyl-L-alanine amidase [Pseudobutyrivibrio sp.]MBE5911685.1 N-acetylmuramoyl-L-alanine amidase [Pseudobutyrivibrio sp.]
MKRFLEIILGVSLIVALAMLFVWIFNDGKNEQKKEVDTAVSEDIEKEETIESTSEDSNSEYKIVIDAGHQGSPSLEKEPIGPGASETKPKVAAGTKGVSTGVYEYELTLEISLQLRDELESRGYQVIMIRESNDVDISNSERAQIANEANADAFIRIHANGSENSADTGAMTICQTMDNPYNGAIYQQCYDLSECVLDSYVDSTGCNREYVWETDTMSGINWCQVPVTIVEMGYMTNPDEDEIMQTPEYQEKIVQGIANGIDDYFEKENENGD